MPRRTTPDEWLAQLAKLRKGELPADAAPLLRRALLDRSNLVVAEAAETVARRSLNELAEELVAAYPRFLINPLETDPQCRAKCAIAAALQDLEYSNADFFLAHVTYRQSEPVWGGSVDTAAPLRASCGYGLVQCGHRQALQVLVDLLADSEKIVRSEAARAIACTGREEAALLLRLKIHCGDREPEVIGACFSGLLNLAPDDGIPFVARFLDAADADVAIEAAAALGESRSAAAFEALKAGWQRHRDPELERAILLSMGASRQSVATEFLLALLAEQPVNTARHVLEALAPCRFYETVRSRVEAVVRQRGDAKLFRLWRREFGEGDGAR